MYSLRVVKTTPLMKSTPPTAIESIIHHVRLLFVGSDTRVKSVVAVEVESVVAVVVNVVVSVLEDELVSVVVIVLDDVEVTVLVYVLD